MAYVALYRQWRPQDFDNLVGQEHISTTLKNAISSGKIAHAYLFTGPRGTGKTSTAKILAKALNCAEGPTPRPCNACGNCEKITAGNSMDVFEIDAASNRGIDEIRDLREAVKFAPVDGRYKVYIIDEVHMLTTEAFNALLKTLEEPPGHVVFVLATTEPHKIPATIHSRCQRYDFRRIAAGEIENRLSLVARSSGLDISPEALKLIAAHADGGLRDALSILDQCAALGEDEITAESVRNLLGLIGHEWVWKLTDAMADRNSVEVLLHLDELVKLGKDVRQVLLELALHIRSLMLYKAAPDVAGIELYSEDKSVLSAQSGRFSHNELVDIIKGLQEAANEAKWAIDPRITAEMALLAVCTRTAGESLAALIERISALEAKLAGAEPPREMVRPEPVHRPPPNPEVPRTERVEKGEEKPAAEPPKPLAPSADVHEIWESVLKELLNGGKRSIHACVSQGQLVMVADGQATVQFKSSFAKERSDKEDYRQIIEKLLAQSVGRQVKLSCVLGAVPTAAPAAVQQPQAGSGIEHPALNQAIKIFGGKVIKEEKNEGDK